MHDGSDGIVFRNQCRKGDPPGRGVKRNEVSTKTVCTLGAVIINRVILKVVDPMCITKLCKDEKYTIMMMYMKSYSCRL